MLVDVHLDQLDLAVGGADGLFEDRRELAARAAPRRPEVDQHRLALRFLDDVLHERLGGRLLDQIGRCLRRRVRCPALLSSRDPRLMSADRAASSTARAGRVQQFPSLNGGLAEISIGFGRSAGREWRPEGRRRSGGSTFRAHDSPASVRFFRSVSDGEGLLQHRVRAAGRGQSGKSFAISTIITVWVGGAGESGIEDGKIRRYGRRRPETCSIRSGASGSGCWRSPTSSDRRPTNSAMRPRCR